MSVTVPADICAPNSQVSPNPRLDLGSETPRLAQIPVYKAKPRLAKRPVYKKKPKVSENPRLLRSDRFPRLLSLPPRLDQIPGYPLTTDSPLSLFFPGYSFSPLTTAFPV